MGIAQSTCSNSKLAFKKHLDEGSVHMNMTSEDAAKLRGKKSVEFILASPNEET